LRNCLSRRPTEKKRKAAQKEKTKQRGGGVRNDENGPIKIGVKVPLKKKGGLPMAAQISRGEGKAGGEGKNWPEEKTCRRK